MSDSAISILDKYIDTTKVSRFSFYSIEMERGENPEDIYYLCTIKDYHYVVFETDYIDSLEATLQEAASIFKEYGLAPVQWIINKESQQVTGTATYPATKPNIDKSRKHLVTNQDASSFSYAVKHAVIEFAKVGKQQQRFHPTAYGNSN